MKIKNGIDLVMVSRIERAYERQGEAFLKKVFTDYERAYAIRKNGSIRWESLAAFFAAKEAISKAFGSGFAEGVHLLEIEIRHDASGAPFYELSGATLETFIQLGFSETTLSISHDAQFAVASCILYGV